jgi:heat shock protein HslJ
MMTFIRLLEGARRIVLTAGIFGFATAGICPAAEANFPFGQELLLDAAPMRPAKRVPILTVAQDGTATIDLWCKTVTGHVEFSDTTVKIEPSPLPDELPQMMGNGQCSPARIQADVDMLAALAQVTAWRKQGTAIILAGPITLKFRPAAN